MKRVRLLVDSDVEEPPACDLGVLRAVGAVVGFGIEGIERDGDLPTPIPLAVISEVRRAAQQRISLDVVLRRFVAAIRVIEEFVMAEAETVPRRVLSQVLADQGPQVDRLIEMAATEYKDEFERLRRSSPQREADHIVDLVQNDSPLIPADIEYNFEIWHVGMIVKGRGAQPAIRSLAGRSGHRALRVIRDPETVWAWLSASRPFSMETLERFLVENTPAEISLAIGEPREGLEGWRLTHREAKVALLAMQHKPQGLTRGRDVVLPVGAMMDETLVRSLLDTYLMPLTTHGDSGRRLLDTLRAYFSVGGNAAAAAVSLGVTRHTVQRRIRTVEQTLGQPLHVCQPQLQVALQIEELIAG